MIATFSQISSRNRRLFIASLAFDLAIFSLLLQVGGSLFENFLLDPVWPENFALIQPDQGGLNRKLFWIPVHAVVTLALPIALWGFWQDPSLRNPILVATLFYLVLRIWSFIYFIPNGLRFESVELQNQSMFHADANEWVFWSLFRLPLLLGTVISLLVVLYRLYKTPRLCS